MPAQGIALGNRTQGLKGRNMPAQGIAPGETEPKA